MRWSSVFRGWRSSRGGVRSLAGSLVLAMFAALSVANAGAQSGLNLFNGTSMMGWNPHGAWSVTGGALTTSSTGDRSLFFAVPFAEFTLQFEYSESGPVGAELRLWTTREGTGGLYIDLDTTGARQGVGGIRDLSRSSVRTVTSGWHHVQVTAAHGGVNVRVDGQPSGSASGLAGRAGYVGFQADLTGQLQVRAIRLTPSGLVSDFNGTDLGGWKSLAHDPKSRAGLGHTAEKVLTFGIGGGSTKPHEAKWTVRGGAIHGEAGPGGLEYSTPADDGMVQLTALYRGPVKQDDFTALSLRSTPGQLGTGYEVGVGPFAGTVAQVMRTGFGRANVPVDETVVIGGRTLAVWAGGTLLSVGTDSRPEGKTAADGARTLAGTLQLVLPTDNVQLDVSRVSSALYPKTFGLAARAAAPPPAPVPVVSASPLASSVPAASAGDSAAAQALLQQQQDAARKDAAAQASRQRVSTLMSQALASTDPQEQENLYEQAIQIDPSNPNAMQGYKEAQSRLQQQQSQNAVAASTSSQEQARQQQATGALLSAQSAFLGGHLAEASNALSVAERLTPGNPMVRELRSRIGAAQSLRSRLFFLGGGVGVLAMLSAAALWWRRRRMQRFPVLEVTNGLDAGKTYRLDKEQTRIGAVPQDGGQRNDIVIRDVEHAISRFHCEVVKRNGQLFVQDLNSSNGTKVDGQRLQPGNAALLRKGTRIQLAGTVELRFGYDRASGKV